MNYDDYKLLCKTCDSILEKNKSIYRVAIPLLHVIREHPIFLKQYQFLFENNTPNKNQSYSNNPTLLSKLCKGVLGFFSSTGSKIQNLTRHQDVDVVIVSHLVNVEYLNRNDDFYFFDIYKHLKNDNFNPLFVLINHTNESFNVLSKQITQSRAPRVVLSNNLGFIGEVKIILGLVKELIIMRLSSFREQGLLKDVLKFSSSVKSLGGTLSALRIGKQVESILKLHNPKTIITTYEGHSWERVVYGVANQYNKNLLRIGYQHSVVSKNAHSINRPLGKQYDPDLILSSGEITHNFLQTAFKDAHSRVLTLGSGKSVEKVAVFTEKKSKTCLVLPEGIIDECETLFNFSLECAKVLPYIDFIWRLHPVICFDEVLRYMSINKDDLPKNVIISNSSLTKDIEKSSHTLYRGTTAVIEAIYGNLIPIYLSDNSGITIDLLYEVGKGRKIVANVGDFIKVVNNKTSYNNNELIDYCERYFMPLNYSILLKELKRVI